MAKNALQKNGDPLDSYFGERISGNKYYPNPKKVQHMLEIRTLQHQLETLPSPRNMW